MQVTGISNYYLELGHYSLVQNVPQKPVYWCLGHQLVALLEGIKTSRVRHKWRKLSHTAISVNFSIWFPAAVRQTSFLQYIPSMVSWASTGPKQQTQPCLDFSQGFCYNDGKLTNTWYFGIHSKGKEEWRYETGSGKSGQMMLPVYTPCTSWAYVTSSLYPIGPSFSDPPSPSTAFNCFYKGFTLPSDGHTTN